MMLGIFQGVVDEFSGRIQTLEGGFIVVDGFEGFEKVVVFV